MKRKVKKISDYKNYDEWVAAMLSSSSKQADHFLKLALTDFEKDGDISALLLALRQVAKAKGGFGKLSDKTGIARENLYAVLSKNGNPTITTFQAIIDALGYSLSLKLSPST